jgi:NDP-sugar pyrophosphorylase family protein
VVERYSYKVDVLGPIPSRRTRLFSIMDKAIILAAGASSRFWPLGQETHKAFYSCGTGKSVLEETVNSLEHLVKELIIAVSPKDLEKAQNIFSKYHKVKIIVMEVPSGAGNTILKALGKDYKGKFFVTFADKIFAGKILEKLINFDQAIALRETDQPQHFGIVSLDKDNYILEVVEKPKKEKAPSKYKISGAYLLNSDIFPLLIKNTKEHYSLEISLNEYFKKNNIKGVFTDQIEETSLKFPWDILNLNQIIQNLYLKSYIEKETKIAKTVVIEGNVYIGKNVKILDYATIIGPVYIGDNSIIGSFSLVRHNSYLGKNVLIGAHSEVKNSILEDNVHIHRSYVGDSIIDHSSRLGAGTVLANKRNDGKNIRSFIKGEKTETGKQALGAVMGANTKIGINSSIMPGVKIGSNSVVYPASLVKKDIEDNKIFKSES